MCWMGKTIKKTFTKTKATKVIMHTAATPDTDIPGTRWYGLDIAEVRTWHKNRGWKDVGYHFFIKRDGTLQYGRPVGTKGAHTLGHNDEIGVCYAGTKIMNEAQLQTLRRLAVNIRDRYGINMFEWYCHRDFANTACPGFDRSKLLKALVDTSIKKIVGD